MRIARSSSICQPMLPQHLGRTICFIAGHTCRFLIAYCLITDLDVRLSVRSHIASLKSKSNKGDNKVNSIVDNFT